MGFKSSSKYNKGLIWALGPGSRIPTVTPNRLYGDVLCEASDRGHQAFDALANADSFVVAFTVSHCKNRNGPDAVR